MLAAKTETTLVQSEWLQLLWPRTDQDKQIEGTILNMKLGVLLALPYPNSF